MMQKERNMFAESDNVIMDKDFDFFGKVVAPIKREFHSHPDNGDIDPYSMKITCYCDVILFKSILHLSKVLPLATWNTLNTGKDLEEVTKITMRGITFECREQTPMTLVFKIEDRNQIKVVNLLKYL
jgi:hypothetical protein